MCLQGGSESSGSSNAGGSSSGRGGTVAGIVPGATSCPTTTHPYSFASNAGIGAAKSENESEYAGGSNESNINKAPNQKSEREKIAAGNIGGGSLISLQTSIRPFRLAIMKAIANQITDCKDALSVIPLLQVLLVILAELDGTMDDEVEIVENLVQRLMDMMNLTVNEKQDIFGFFGMNLLKPYLILM